MTFTSYGSLKPSGVDWIGEIPSSWQVDKFRYVFRESGEKIKDEVVGKMLSVSGYRGIEIKEYEDDNRRRLDHELVGYRIVRQGQLVVNTMWLNYAGLGVSAYEGHVSPAYRSYWINDAINGRYAHYLLRSGLYVQGYTQLLTGVRPNSLQMSRDDLFAFPILLPPREEQLTIANFLDHETAKIDALIAEQQRLIELLKEKRQAVISHAVTKGLDPSVPMKDSGVEWLGEVPVHWEVKQLKHVVDPRSSITYGIVQAGPEYEGGVPYIRTSDMSGDQLPTEGYPLTSPEIDASYARSRVVPGDLVISIRASVGKCLPFPDELKVANLTQGTAKISPGKLISRDFLMAYLNGSASQQYFDLMAKGATFREITLDALRRAPVLVPPRKEQVSIEQAISRRSALLENTLLAASKSIRLLKERRSALISAAVTGKIDLREFRPD